MHLTLKKNNKSYKHLKGRKFNPMSPLIELNDRVVNVLRELMISQKKKIKESFEQTKKIEIGTINNFDITNVRKHSGYGGTTYLVSANLSTSSHGVIPGGMVIKFPNNLEEEEKNAIALQKLCEKRQKLWDDSTEKDDLPDSIKRFPNFVFAPKVLQTVTVGQTSCLMLEFVDGAVPLIDSQEKGGFDEKLKILGYSLARLHGKLSYSTNIELYNPIFNHIKNTNIIDKDILTNWHDVFKQANGSVEFIHGDSHLQNVLKTYTGNQESIAWIDAMLVEASDRMDDVGYALSFLVQKDVQTFHSQNLDPNTIISQVSNKIIQSWAPLVLQAYHDTVNIKRLYKTLPLDFFLGAHCIIRADLWEDPTMKWLLQQIGNYFITHAPVNYYFNQ